jgi:hypothetical protein
MIICSIRSTSPRDRRANLRFVSIVRRSPWATIALTGLPAGRPARRPDQPHSPRRVGPPIPLSPDRGSWRLVSAGQKVNSPPPRRRPLVHAQQSALPAALIGGTGHTSWSTHPKRGGFLLRLPVRHRIGPLQSPCLSSANSFPNLWDCHLAVRAGLGSPAARRCRAHPG